MATTELTGPGPTAEPARRRPGAGRAVVAIVVTAVLVAGGTAAWAWLRGSVAAIPIREHCATTVGDGTSDLDPEQAGNAAIIAAVAVRRGLPARAATIGIATAMQESKLRNIAYGDRDSLGLFQQRPSQGWGTAAQVRDPVYASNAFYDVLVKIEGYASLPITDAAQKVQRSAFPSAYADHEPEARVLASALSGYSPGAFSCVLRAADVVRQAPAASGLTPRAAAVVTAAKAETGRTGTLERTGSGAAGSTDAANAATGTTVRFTVPTKDAGRLSWSLAQWAVARADALGVDEVQVAGKRWRRDRVDQGWTALSGGPASGTVVVRVAAGS
jgi:hypothetical protein